MLLKQVLYKYLGLHSTTLSSLIRKFVLNLFMSCVLLRTQS